MLKKLELIVTEYLGWEEEQRRGRRNRRIGKRGGRMRG